MLDPIPDAPAAIWDGPERVLVVADVHAGIEAEHRREGVELPNGSADRRERLVGLIDAHDPDRLVVAGDLGTTIGRPTGAEREEIVALLAAATERVPVTVVPGNHDGDLAAIVESDEGENGLTITPASGAQFGELSVCHGHTWPDGSLLAGETIVLGHEHPRVRLTDTVGGGRTERVWLRGRLDTEPLRDQGYEIATPPRVVVLPAFNDRSGGHPLNVPDRSFLSPLLDAALVDPEAFLLDGTRLGPLDGI
ncbi:metallophosphoesterase [Halococcoides cellulosivorans]|uniref:metallophosphoesterase n=1 Tax=Halococcoides cellulosivorans TaxID=1679096 RepID=UPI001F37374B|nr:metallophosphoesterase [Halococcoides cellulosivorans]